MKQRSVFLRTQSVAVALRAARRAHFEHVSSTRRTGKQLQRMRRASFRRASVRIHLFAAVFAACFASPADAITLENVLQTTLERNPDIQEAKSGLEQAAGKRLVFLYAALYNRSLESLRREQQRRLQENVTAQRTRFEAGLTDKTALASATVQASELDTRIEGAHRTYLDARLQLALVMGIDPAKASLPEPEGELHSIPIRVDVDSETAAALQRRADLKLARLFVRAANEDQRIIEADYYPAVIGSLPGEYVPVTGIHREGSTSKTQDFIGSEIREKAAYTWRVVRSEEHTSELQSRF